MVTSAITFTSVYNEVLVPNCVSCHGANGMGMLSMPDKASAYKELVGVKPKVACMTDFDRLRVSPGDPQRSELVAALDWPTMTDAVCAPKMPKGKAQLDEVLRKKVRDWVMAGANND